MPGNVVYSAGVLGPRFLLVALLLLALLFGQSYVELNYLSYGRNFPIHWFFYQAVYPFCYALAWARVPRQPILGALATASAVGGSMLLLGLALSFATFWVALFGHAFVEQLTRTWHPPAGRPTHSSIYVFVAVAGAAFGYGLWLVQRRLLGEPTNWRFSAKRVHVLWAAFAAPVVFHVSEMAGNVYPLPAAKLAPVVGLTKVVWVVSAVHLLAVWLCLPRAEDSAAARPSLFGRPVRYAVGTIAAIAMVAAYFHFVVSRISA